MGREYGECFDEDDERDYQEEDPRMMFADPGGTSSLRAATKTNPRNLPCPTCHTPNRLTPADKALGYQCDSCANASEGYGEINYYALSEELVHTQTLKWRYTDDYITEHEKELEGIHDFDLNEEYELTYPQQIIAKGKHEYVIKPNINGAFELIVNMGIMYPYEMATAAAAFNMAELLELSKADSEPIQVDCDENTILTVAAEKYAGMK